MRYLIALNLIIYITLYTQVYAIESVETYVREPEIEQYETFIAEVSAYTASPRETDDRYWEMASGETVYVGAIACPSRYEYGTIVNINDQRYICEDRMNKRYRHGNYFDIYMETKEEALYFGRQKLQVIIK